MAKLRKKEVINFPRVRRKKRRGERLSHANRKRKMKKKFNSKNRRNGYLHRNFSWEKERLGHIEKGGKKNKAIIAYEECTEKSLTSSLPLRLKKGKEKSRKNPRIKP